MSARRSRRSACDPARQLRRPRLGHVPGQLAHGAQAPLADHAFGGLEDRVEDALDLAALAADRTERIVEVALLGVTVPPHRQKLVLGSRCFARRQDVLEKGPDCVQISGQTSCAVCPTAQGCLAPGIGLQASL